MPNVGCKECSTEFSRLFSVLFTSLCLFLGQTSWANEIADPLIVQVDREEFLGNYDQAIRLLESSRRKDAPDVLYRLGWLLAQRDAGDESKLRGIALLERAASMNYPPAMTRLAEIYGRYIVLGLPENPTKWRNLMEGASALGYGVASLELAGAYLSGQAQLPKDNRMSNKYLQLAEQQWTTSQLVHHSPEKKQIALGAFLGRLSRFYEKGMDGVPDMARAFAYSFLADGDDDKKIASKLSKDERQAGLEFAKKWLEQHQRQDIEVPALLRQDIPNDARTLVKTLVSTSPILALVKSANIKAYLERGAEVQALSFMMSDGRWSPAHPNWQPIYSQALKEVQQANRQLVKQLAEEEQSRGNIEVLLEKNLTVDELRLLVAFYDDKNIKTIARATSLIMDISRNAAFKLAELSAAEPNDVSKIFQKVSRNLAVEKSKMTSNRQSVLHNSVTGLVFFSAQMGVIPRGPGMIKGGEIGLELSSCRDEWLEFFVLEGGWIINVFQRGVNSPFYKEKQAILDWIGGAAKKSAAWDAYNQEIQAIWARTREAQNNTRKKDVNQWESKSMTINGVNKCGQQA